MGDLSMDGGASVGGRVKLVFPITPIRMSSNVQEVVLAWVSGVMVNDVVDVDSGGSEVSERDDSRVVGISSIMNPCTR